MSRRLVITVDDVGVERATAVAVAELAGGGRVSAASVIPMAAWARHAVATLGPLAGPGASLSLGVHATFTAAEPGWSAWGPWTGGRSLVRPGGGFYPEVAQFASAADPRDVAVELRAQVAWFAPSGVRPTHLDSHHGALYGIEGPDFLLAAVEVCAEQGLALRLPRAIPQELGALSPGLLRAHRGAVARADDLGVRLPETIGTDWRPQQSIAGYDDLRDAYLRLIRQLPEGLSEIFLHPAPESARAGGTATAKRTWEHRFLHDDALGDVLAAEAVDVVRWPAAAGPRGDAPAAESPDVVRGPGTQERARQGPPGTSAGRALSALRRMRQR